VPTHSGNHSERGFSFLQSSEEILPRGFPSFGRRTAARPGKQLGQQMQKWGENFSYHKRAGGGGRGAAAGRILSGMSAIPELSGNNPSEICRAIIRLGLK